MRPHVLLKALFLSLRSSSRRENMLTLSITKGMLLFADFEISTGKNPTEIETLPYDEHALRRQKSTWQSKRK